MLFFTMILKPPVNCDSLVAADSKKEKVCCAHIGFLDPFMCFVFIYMVVVQSYVGGPQIS